MESPVTFQDRASVARTTSQKKADVAKHPEVFRHVGLLFNRPTGMAGLHFNESSEFQFNDSTEPISNGHRLPAADSITFGT